MAPTLKELKAKVMPNIFKKLVHSELTELLSFPPFLNFILSVMFSQVALNMMNAVLIFLIFHLTSSNFPVSVLVMTFIIPQIFLSFIGGMVADLKDKRRILLYGNLIRGVILLVLFFQTNVIALVYLVSLLVSITSQFYVPAETPVIPKLVQKKYLVPANSLFGIGLFGSLMVGYVFAGPAILLLGRSNVFLLLAALFFLASLFIYLIPEKLISNHNNITPNFFESLKNSVRSEFRKTYSILSDLKGVSSAFFLLGFSQVIILMLVAIVPGYANNVLEIPAENMSLYLFSPAALGMIISSLLIGSVLKRVKKTKLMTLGIIISGVGFLLFPFTSRIIAKGFIVFINTLLPNFFKIDIVHVAILLSFIAGFANAFIFVPSQSIIQEKVPEVFRSKVYGLLFGLVGIFSLFPLIIIGWAADLLGVGKVFFMIGALILLVGITRVVKLFRRIEKVGI